jgi:hypothetical protein
MSSALATNLTASDGPRGLRHIEVASESLTLTSCLGAKRRKDRRDPPTQSPLDPVETVIYFQVSFLKIAVCLSCNLLYSTAK